MTPLDIFFSNEMVRWVKRNINNLPDKAKFRAYNAIRALEWADRINQIRLTIPATYCAMHATEEAVAAFVSSAKVSGYGDDAKINIRDHHAKAVVSMIAQKLTTLLGSFAPAIAYDPQGDQIVLRVRVDDAETYAPASMGRFLSYDSETGEMSGDFYENFIAAFSDMDELRNVLRHSQEARNKIFYADDTGYPTGFGDPSESLTREAFLTVGLIWASLDITSNAHQQIPFYKQALRTANRVISETKRKQNTSKC